MQQQRPDFDEEKRDQAFMRAFERTSPEGSRSDVDGLNRRNRELLAANVKLHDENQTLRRRLRALGEHA